MTCGKVERDAQREGAGQPAVRRTPALGDVKHSDRAASDLPARHATGTRTAWRSPGVDRGENIGFWVQANGKEYWLEVDEKRTLLAASVLVSAHDKSPTVRRLTHPVTLARLQAIVRPPALCALCGNAAAP